MGYFPLSMIIEPPKDLPFYEYLGTKFYMLEFFHEKLNLSDEEMLKTFDCMNDYIRRANEVFSDSSILMGFSSTNSKKNFRDEVIKTGKPGRPKRKKVGYKINPHIHTIATGTQAEEALEFIKNSLDKKFKKIAGCKICRVSPWKGIGAPYYIYKQSDITRKVPKKGGFDFEKLNDFWCSLY